MSKLKKDRLRYNRRRNRSKNEVSSPHNRYRLCVFRSNKNIEAQIIDDMEGKTLVSSSSIEKSLSKDIKPGMNKFEISKVVGTALGDRATKIKINKVAFDRNGYPYHGRIKALADAARKSGLEF